MTGQQRDPDTLRGPCNATSVHRPRYGWLAALASLLLVVTALWSMGDHPYAIESRAFTLLNGLPDGLVYVLIPVMQAGSFAAVFVAGILALLARRPHLAGLLVLAGGSAWVLAKLVKRVVERGRPDEYLADVVIRGAVQMGQGFPSGHAAVIAAMATVAAPYSEPAGTHPDVDRRRARRSGARLHRRPPAPRRRGRSPRGLGPRVRHQPDAGDARSGVPTALSRLLRAGVKRDGMRNDLRERRGGRPSTA